MSAREIIVYVRLADAQASLVDSSNNVLTEQKYPIIYYNEKPILKLRPLRLDGTPYLLSDFSGYATFEFGIDDDWDRTTQNLVHAISGTDDFTVSEVTVGTVTYVQIAVELNGNTVALGAALNTSKEVRTNVFAELSCFNAGIIEPQNIIQFPFVLRNKLIDVNSSTPEEPTSNYPTFAQTNALLATKLDKIFSSSATLTDNTANTITLGSISSYQAITIKGYIRNAAGSVNYFSGAIYHNGTTAENNIKLTDFGGLFITGVTFPFTADISGDNLRLIITLSGAGQNLTCKYGIENYIGV